MPVARWASRGLKLASTVMLGLAVATSIGIGIVLILAHAHGQQLLSVQTGSMVPTFRPGDVISVVPVTAASLVPGEVVSYHNPRHPTEVISHRLVAINRQTGWLTTQGDALDTADPAFSPNLVIGRVTIVIPGLGRLLGLLRQPLDLIVIIYIPAAGLIIHELYRLRRSYGVHYRLQTTR